MGELIYQGTYTEFKIELDAEMRSAAESYVRIGYLLKVARDTDVLSTSGYETLADFAKGEYGLTKDIVSRWIAINDKYSEGGYSDRLQERYRGYGVAKLAELLTVPDVIAEQIPAEMPKSEIQDIKRDIREEKQVTDLERMMEPGQQAEIELENKLEQGLYEHFRDAEIFEKMFKATEEEVLDTKLAMEIIAPYGMVNLRPKVPGVGRVMIAISSIDDPIVVTDIRAMETEKYTIEQVVDFLQKLSLLTDTWQQAYEAVYGELPKIEAVVKEEPKAQEVKAQEPKAQKTEAQKPKAQEAGAQEIKAQEPKAQPEEENDDISDHEGRADELGASGDDGEPDRDEEVPGSAEAAVDPEGHGETESGGSEAGSEQMIWMKIQKEHDELTKRLAVWGVENADAETLRKMYGNAVSMAAGFENLLMAKGEVI